MGGFKEWVDGWAVFEVWAVKPRFYKDKVFKVGGGRGQGGSKRFEFARGMRVKVRGE
jgi:hypothetical protein